MHGQPLESPGAPTNIFVVRLRDVDMRFRTRAGVFSSKGLDDGTRLLLNHLETGEQFRFADLGCGSGVIGIAHAKLNPLSRVDLLDANVRAVSLAAENVRLNGLANAEVYVSDLFSAVGDALYDRIAANPPAQLGNAFLKELVVECWRHLAPAGVLDIVVVRNLYPVIDRLLSRADAPHASIAQGPKHRLVRARKAANSIGRRT